MEHVTVRRWVDAPADEVWRRLTDLDTLVAREPALDLVDVGGEDGPLGPCGSAVLTRRHGPRLTTLSLKVMTTEPPCHLSLSVASGRSAQWVVSVDVEELATGASDVTIRARRNPGAPGVRRPAATSRAAHRMASDLAGVLEALGRRAEGTALIGTGPE